MELTAVMSQLQSLGTAQAVKTYKRHGAGDDVFLACALNQFVAAMGADVVEAADCTIAALGDEDVLVVDFRGEVGPFVIHLTNMAGVVPCPIENRVLLRLIDAGVGVEPRGHCEG